MKSTARSKDISVDWAEMIQLALLTKIFHIKVIMKRAHITFDQQISREEVEEAIHQIRPRKACGEDAFPNEFIIH